MPFHITNGPPLCGSVGSASSAFGSGSSSVMCAGLTTNQPVPIYHALSQQDGIYLDVAAAEAKAAAAREVGLQAAGSLPPGVGTLKL